MQVAAYGFRDSAERPHLEPLGTRGYVIDYPRCDQDTLVAIRSFQGTVSVSQPGWLTRMHFVNGHCRLYVFPVADTPSAVFSQ